ncbi:hypothetical protein CXB51_023954 [Gossypium anomalum]|uniref:Reverse transcriptase Ty1/copia-type domain-containing protein n=1 Tax=Gossypium anomalum TaxID=47600 RepID=A0A8J5YIP6_9ROSI|nr:hypothetical protein CXB51_023954 [Gossypium anomalum]
MQSLPTASSSSVLPQPAVKSCAPSVDTRNSHAMVTRSKAGIFKPKVYLTTVACSDVPVDKHAAMKHKCWVDAVHAELQAFERNNTWILCSLPSYRRTIGYKCPMVHAVTIRTILAIAVMKKWQLRQVDVNNVFLNGELTEEIFMDQPPGFEVFDSSGQKLVCCLNKALYGLRQAPCAWFHALKQFLTDVLGFHASHADLSLFVRTSFDGQLLLMAYVDDIVITGSSGAAIDSVVRQLHSKFALKDMSRLNFFLGIEIHTTSQGMYLSQRKYVKEILAKANITGVAATLTPMVCMPKLVAFDESQACLDGHLYRSLVGMLQYLCITRPDLSFYVNKPSQYMNSPSDSHWKVVKRVLSYLIGTLEYGLCYSHGQCKLVGYSDADWASSIEDRRSTTEEEYRSLDYCVSEVLWFKQLLAEIRVGLEQTPVVWCDNTSTVSMSANLTHHTRVKHVEIDHHFVREKVLDGTIQVNYVPSANQVVDILTKPIPPKQFVEFRHALQVTPVNTVVRSELQKRKEPGEC